MKVISCSRRIELVGCYPDELVEFLKRFPPSKVHTLVVWTKDGRNLIHHKRLNRKIMEYEQLYLHYTITGIGGSFLEPRVPPKEILFKSLPKIIKLVGGPDRIRMRFDPILHLRLSNGEIYSNIKEFEGIANVASNLGIINFTTSWLSIYPKVLRRLQRNKISPIKLTSSERKKEAEELCGIAKKYGITINWCCVPRMPRSRCIDGELLTRLHPRGSPCSTIEAKGQRPLCGCTESFDIGWYNPCPYGCLYCYANPKECR